MMCARKLVQTTTSRFRILLVTGSFSSSEFSSQGKSYTWMAKGCCDDGMFGMIDLNKMELPAFLSDCQGPRVNWSDSSLFVAAGFIIFNPFFWNFMARLELNTQIISRLCGGPRMGCTGLAATILFLGALRGRVFQLAVYGQSTWPGLQTPIVHYTGAGLISLGLFFAITSFLALGFYGTFLGDYFGILMEHRVTTFPFNIMENPMYWGSTMEYLGFSLWYGPSPAGLLLTILLAVCYKIAILIEGPYTEKIYQKAAKQSKKLR